jgi:hypothetical protein
MSLLSILGLSSNSIVKIQGNNVTKLFRDSVKCEDEYRNLCMLKQQGVSVPTAYATTKQRHGFFNKVHYGIVMSHVPGFDLTQIDNMPDYELVRYPRSMVSRSWKLLEAELAKAKMLGWAPGNDTSYAGNAVYNPVTDKLTLTDVSNWRFQG